MEFEYSPHRKDGVSLMVTASLPAASTSPDLVLTDMACSSLATILSARPPRLRGDTSDEGNCACRLAEWCLCNSPLLKWAAASPTPSPFTATPFFTVPSHRSSVHVSVAQERLDIRARQASTDLPTPPDPSCNCDVLDLVSNQRIVWGPPVPRHKEGGDPESDTAILTARTFAAAFWNCGLISDLDNVVFTDGGYDADATIPGAAGILARCNGSWLEASIASPLADSSTYPELEAIRLSLSYLSSRADPSSSDGDDTPPRQTWIFSDSQPALAIASSTTPEANSPSLQRLTLDWPCLDNIHYIKVISHVGIPGNERADRLASTHSDFHDFRPAADFSCAAYHEGLASYSQSLAALSTYAAHPRRLRCFSSGPRPLSPDPTPSGPAGMVAQAIAQCNDLDQYAPLCSAVGLFPGPLRTVARSHLRTNGVKKDDLDSATSDLILTMLITNADHLRRMFQHFNRARAAAFDCDLAPIGGR